MNWFKDLQQKKKSKEPHTEIYNEFELVLEGTTINGQHIHIYKSNVNGLIDWSVEE